MRSTRPTSLLARIVTGAGVALLCTALPARAQEGDDPVDATTTTIVDPAVEGPTTTTVDGTTATTVEEPAATDAGLAVLSAGADQRAAAVPTASDPYVLTVTPTTGLAPNQEVTVTVSGASPNEPLFIFECNRVDPPAKTAPPPNALNYCVFAAGKYKSQLPADASGNLTTTFTALSGTYASLGNDVVIGDTAYLFVADATDTLPELPESAHAKLTFGGAQTTTTTTGTGGGGGSPTTAGDTGGGSGSGSGSGSGTGSQLPNTGANSIPLTLGGLASILVGIGLHRASQRRLSAAVGEVTS